MQGKIILKRTENIRYYFNVVYGLLYVCHLNGILRCHVHYVLRKCVQQNEQNG
jgi:hypothetical protein